MIHNAQMFFLLSFSISSFIQIGPLSEKVNLYLTRKSDEKVKEGSVFLESKGNHEWICSRYRSIQWIQPFRGFRSSSEPLGPSLKFRHDRGGLAFLEEKVLKLQEKLEAEPVFVYEATGVYAKPVERYLLSHGCRLCQIIPLESAAQRRTDIHGKKTDKTDPAYIAQAYFSKRKKAPKEKEDLYWHVLRLMNREYRAPLRSCSPGTRRWEKTPIPPSR